MTVTTIIFGPSGAVASFAASYVAAKGAKVVLAMRDPKKPLPDIAESSGTFTRVQADLTDASSVLSAVKSTNPDTAFIYNLQTPEGTPKASVQALKDGGVKRVVLLSSYSVSDPIDAITESDIIPYSHAQVEKSLHSIFGEGYYTAVRPAFFASNTFRYVPQIKQGLVREMYPTASADYIVPRDIGEVSGSLLLREAGPLPRVVDLTGQQVVQQDEALKLCAAAVGIDLKVEEVEVQEAVKLMIGQGIPESYAQYLGKIQAEMYANPESMFGGPRFEAGQKSVKELLGRDGITLQQWIEENKAVFA